MPKRSLEEIIQDGTKQSGGGREALLRVLSEVNRAFGFVSEADMRTIAGKLRLSPAEVESVTSFYAFLSRTRRGRHLVRLCDTISCHLADAQALLNSVETDLGIHAGQTTPDERITLETTRCLGLCDQGPAMLVDETPYTKLTPDKAREILHGLR